MNSRRLLRSALCLCCVGMLAAASRSTTAAAVGAAGGQTAGFCSVVVTHGEAAQARVDTAQTALIESWKQQLDSFETDKIHQNEAIASLRADIDASREANIAAFRTNVRSDHQAQAVALYASATAEAVQTRRQTVDTARATYQKAVRTVLEEHQAVLAGRAQAFRIQVGDAYAAAASDCGEEQADSVVQATLNQRLEAAREQFGKGQSDRAVSGRIAQLAHRRQQQEKAANSAYNDAMRVARQQLNQALDRS